MGVHLAMLLSKQGNDVFVTTRKDRMNNAGITYLRGNAHDPLIYRGNLTGGLGCDCRFHGVSYG